MFNVQFLIAYAVTSIAFLGLDAIWLTTMADRLYRPNLGPMLLEKYALMPALAFYVIYMVGLTTFAVSPALASGKWTTALGLGALLGLVAYATYDLTNQATLRDWPVIVTVADLVWGTVASAAAAAIGYGVTSWISDKITS